MTIYITGDTHGTHDIYKLEENFFDSTGLTKDDYVIICGDFGFVWFYEGGKGWVEDQEWLDWLEDRPWTTLFVDGNHENHELLNQYPVEKWHGGKVHFIRDSVIHLMRGQIFEIDGNTFLTMGGAHSIDRAYRTDRLSWWEEEIPSYVERCEALENLSKCGWQVDYVVSHDGPSEAVRAIGSRMHDPHWVDEWTDWLQTEIAEHLEFKRWFFGHHHKDMALLERYLVLYEEILKLE